MPYRYSSMSYRPLPVTWIRDLLSFLFSSFLLICFYFVCHICMWKMFPKRRVNGKLHIMIQYNYSLRGSYINFFCNLTMNEYCKKMCACICLMRYTFYLSIVNVHRLCGFIKMRVCVRRVPQIGAISRGGRGLRLRNDISSLHAHMRNRGTK